jgi:hypothetical protein
LPPATSSRRCCERKTRVDCKLTLKQDAQETKLNHNVQQFNCRNRLLLVQVAGLASLGRLSRRRPVTQVQESLPSKVTDSQSGTDSRGTGLRRVCGRATACVPPGCRWCQLASIPTVLVPGVASTTELVKRCCSVREESLLQVFERILDVSCSC